jgi:hypothetical protein
MSCPSHRVGPGVKFVPKPYEDDLDSCGARCEPEPDCEPKPLDPVAWELDVCAVA